MLQSTRLDVSVLMLTYNHEAYVEEAIQSVLAHASEVRLELVISDDASTDATAKIVAGFAERNPGTIKAIIGEKNLGLGENFRRLVRSARGRYIAFCEGDDWWLPGDHLARRVELLDQCPIAAFAYARFLRAAQVDGDWRIASAGGEQVRQGLTVEDLMDRIDIHLSTMVCRSELVYGYVESDLYDPTLWLSDVPLILALSMRGSVQGFNADVSVYRHHPASITQASARSRLRVVTDHVTAVRRFEHFAGSPEQRRAARTSTLNRMLATAAYAAGDRALFRKHADKRSLTDLMRNAIMLFPPLHRSWLERARAKQRQAFLSASI